MRKLRRSNKIVSHIDFLKQTGGLWCGVILTTAHAAALGVKREALLNIK